MWSIPWLAAMRAIFYRRDLLEQAGVDEKTAFLSHPQLIQTLERLRASSIPTPLVLNTRNIFSPSLHNLASWVWEAGGGFVSKDGTRTLLNLPETRAGIRAFLELGQYLSPEARGLDGPQSEALFWQGQAAVSLSWQVPLLTNLGRFAAPHVIANLGVAPTPGVTFIGGSNLVVWRHIAPSHESLAMDLVRFLTSQQVQSSYTSQVGFFPVRPEVLQAPPFGTDSFYQFLIQGLKTGRTFQAIAQWGLIEDRLLRALGQLWENVLAHPEGDIDAIIAEQLDPLAQRLDHLLQPT